MPNRALSIVLMSVLLASCAMERRYERPAAELPAGWNVSAAPGELTADRAGADWWTLYGDVELDSLVQEALLNNADLQLAVARVDEARALLDVTRAGQSVQVDGSLERGRSRASTATGSVPAGVPVERNDYRAAITASYELDLWGRLRSATAASRAELLATQAARETVRSALAASVVQAYFGLVALDDQLEATRRSVATRGEGMDLQRKRYEAGVVSQLEMGQARSELATAEAQLPALERRRRQTQTALAVLAGRSARAVFGDAQSGEPAAPARPGAAVPAPMVVPAGLPSDLLLRRPDIVAAEQRLVAMSARVDQARASLFPSISLTGLLGSQSAALGELFTGPAGIWSLAAGVLQPVFSGGRLRAGVAASEARERQALIQYQQAIQNAFKDVRDALDGQDLARRQLEAETRRADNLRDNHRLARRSYENGVASLLDVMDAERSLLAAELNRADALRAQRAAVADLFKALGGGWDEGQG